MQNQHHQTVGGKAAFGPMSDESMGAIALKILTHQWVKEGVVGGKDYKRAAGELAPKIDEKPEVVLMFMRQLTPLVLGKILDASQVSIVYNKD